MSNNPLKHDYDTLSEAIEGLRAEGYELDFNLQENSLECAQDKMCYNPSQFTITRSLRFEGMSNPDDNSVLYALETHNGNKGLLVDAYGVYSDALSPEMIEKLRVNYQQ